jgi:hypothetical protein
MKEGERHLNAAKGQLENLMRRGCSVRAWLVVIANVAETAFVSVLGLLSRLANRWVGHIIRRLIGIAAGGRRFMRRSLYFLGCHGADTSPRAQACLSAERSTTCRCAPTREHATTLRPLLFCLSKAGSAAEARLCVVPWERIAREEKPATDIPEGSMSIHGAPEHARSNPINIDARAWLSTKAKFSKINSWLQKFGGFGNQRAAMGHASDCDDAY